ncbi:hypothetical protein [Brevibacillus brevis]|uniref:Uncharacterized protein n=1 Tax=Brevibacillus brevis TaxID=1393 RepID=A0A517IGJ7_BREBE|nr:hypothetical protein [Brevibacillus brevis]QDS37998.1 hypothetical protein FPS98_30665 [Brevibacillus brevis]
MSRRKKIRSLSLKQTVPFVADMSSNRRAAMLVGEKIVYRGQEGTITKFVHVIAEANRVILVGEMEVNVKDPALER